MGPFELSLNLPADTMGKVLATITTQPSYDETKCRNANRICRRTIDPSSYVFQKVIDRKETLHLRNVSIPPAVLLIRMIEINCSWNLVHSVKNLLDNPIGRIRETRDVLRIE